MRLFNIVNKKNNIDSGLCYGYCTSFEGQSVITHKDGWTALSFWDRSIDSRPGSNSNFLAEGIFSFDEMVKLAQEKFPSVWNRFKFPIVEVTSK
jgi:hypothetical protein